jgi:exodeoxyribonuclease V alpha subunit|tara:strand:- start:3216 stop:5084 length:1869 start_codon:yes stop_codon:yes gene_type:complete
VTKALTKLRSIADAGVISELDYQFARFIGARSGMDAELLLVSAAVSHALSRMNSCIDLADLCGRTELFGSADLVMPPLEELLQKLRLADAVGQPGDAKPLILATERLYLSRYFTYETVIAADLMRRAKATRDVPTDSLATVLQRYFPTETGHANRQRLAAAIAATRGLTVITGGPGTGKTTTVVRMLALLLEQAEQSQLAIKLAAPTGKAAMRLTQSIEEFLGNEDALPCSDEIRSEIPTEVSTLHRLLGVRRHSHGFRHNRDNPLRVDVLVVDEVSMVDLSMMAKLLMALPDHTRLILIGDQHQLPSVEVGSILADLSACGSEHGGQPGYSKAYGKLLKELCGFDPGRSPSANAISDSCCELAHGYRFAKESGIARLAEGIRRVEAADLQELLAEIAAGGTVDIALLPVDSTLSDAGMDAMITGYRPFLDCLDTDKADTRATLAAFDQFRVLSALREGEQGVIELNKRIESRLQLQESDDESAYYPGRPILITRNDYNLQLFNGDTGVCLVDPGDGRLKVCFLDSDGCIRDFLPTRLPPHETCFAMTVHKSQGSEYQKVALVLPEQTDAHSSDLLNRQLLYTGITRAREKVTLFANEATLVEMAARSSNRISGLRDKLMME